MNGVKAKEVQVQSEVLEQRKACELLKEAIHALFDRLSYVSRMESQSGKTESCDKQQPVLVQLAGEIHFNTDLLYSLRTDVNEAINRLEI